MGQNHPVGHDQHMMIIRLKRDICKFVVENFHTSFEIYIAPKRRESLFFENGLKMPEPACITSFSTHGEANN